MLLPENLSYHLISFNSLILLCPLLCSYYQICYISSFESPKYNYICIILSNWFLNYLREGICTYLIFVVAVYNHAQSHLFYSVHLISVSFCLLLFLSWNSELPLNCSPLILIEVLFLTTLLCMEFFMLFFQIRTDCLGVIMEFSSMPVLLEKFPAPLHTSWEKWQFCKLAPHHVVTPAILKHCFRKSHV